MPVSDLNGEAPSVSWPLRILKRCVFTEKSVSSELLVGQGSRVLCKQSAKTSVIEDQVVERHGCGSRRNLCQDSSPPLWQLALVKWQENQPECDARP